MAIGRAFAGAYQLGFPVTLADGSTAYAQAAVLTDASGTPVNVGANGFDLDTNGNAVPTYKAHSFTFDKSGNLATDTVTDGASTWVRTYVYQEGAPVSDSGWVKQ